MTEHSAESVYIELTADIVSAYVSNNSVPSADIPNLIGQIYSALKRVSGGQAAAPSEPLKPAVPIKRSVTAEYIICLEDGQKFKSLKRHLRTRYNMTPDQYREKWGLAPAAKSAPDQSRPFAPRVLRLSIHFTRSVPGKSGAVSAAGRIL